MRFSLHAHKYIRTVYIHIYDTDSFVLLIAVRNQRVNRVYTYVVLYTSSAARRVRPTEIRLVGI